MYPETGSVAEKAAAFEKLRRSPAARDGVEPSTATKAIIRKPGGYSDL